MVLNINQDEYIEKFGQAAGVRVLVHSQAKMPFPEDEGLLARTGQLTSVSIVKVFSSLICCSIITISLSFKVCSSLAPGLHLWSIANV